ncbi:TraB/GumN family protein [Cypionkella aquatica]|uniref:TraB/GumN family protein n=1 Tax=Cypionkella aquatica TaxID=1756042 RepID=A0AA37WZB7_9RHOB|nr:TraB/GumN family protein [Cypionkella aquatica]GLS86388.1 TraB/GumN family protein [Cypionkella aquatica]
MRQILSTFMALLAFSTPALAECQGQNLIAALPADQQANLRAEAAKQPYAIGNFWLATKGDQQITLVGTYHFDDPRHSATMTALAPAIARAQILLVEAGPKEQDSLKARMADDPSLIVNTDGPTLPEVLSPEDWQHLSDAAKARGMPAFMVAKFRPWYVSVLLAMPPCSLGTAMPEGLDAQLIQAAKARDLPVQALEPYDTLFSIFGDMTQAEQIDMITSALALEDKSADMAITLADAYFAQEGRLIWEFSKLQALQQPGFTPERVQREFAVMEKSMMTDRNTAWIPVIEAAAAKGPVLAAFGALHLSGDQGVLNLLQARGYKVTQLSLVP